MGVAVDILLAYTASKTAGERAFQPAWAAGTSAVVLLAIQLLKAPVHDDVRGTERLCQSVICLLQSQRNYANLTGGVKSEAAMRHPK